MKAIPVLIGNANCDRYFWFSLKIQEIVVGHNYPIIFDLKRAPTGIGQQSVCLSAIDPSLRGKGRNRQVLDGGLTDILRGKFDIGKAIGRRENLRLDGDGVEASTPTIVDPGYGKAPGRH